MPDLVHHSFARAGYKEMEILIPVATLALAIGNVFSQGSPTVVIGFAAACSLTTCIVSSIFPKYSKPAVNKIRFAANLAVLCLLALALLMVLGVCGSSELALMTCTFLGLTAPPAVALLACFIPTRLFRPPSTFRKLPPPSLHLRLASGGVHEIGLVKVAAKAATRSPRVASLSARVSALPPALHVHSSARTGGAGVTVPEAWREQ
jgi:hypothetical protein